MPRFYAPLDPKAGEKGATCYQVLVGGGALFEVKDKVKIGDVKDGTVNTLMVVEADRTVLWTKPEDLTYSPERRLPGSASSRMASSRRRPTAPFISSSGRPTRWS